MTLDELATLLEKRAEESKILAEKYIRKHRVSRRPFEKKAAEVYAYLKAAAAACRELEDKRGAGVSARFLDGPCDPVLDQLTDEALSRCVP